MAKELITYGKHYVDSNDIFAVNEVLRSSFLTTGPKVIEFEKAVADYVNAKYGIAVSSGTAALHCAMYAINIQPGDEVIVPPMTFAATVNSVIFQGGTPVFVDVCPNSLLIDTEKIEEKITHKTKAIITVDFAGHPSKYDRLVEISRQHNIVFIADSCHALGAEYKGKRVGSLADLSIFSFHPVKQITTGEGGMITTDNFEYAKRIYRFRNHGINIDFRQRAKNESWIYEISDLGYNYRITDIQCALGLSQLKKLPDFIQARKNIAKIYNNAFINYDKLEPLMVDEDVLHAYHLYVIKLQDHIDRGDIFRKLLKSHIGVNVHYIPVYLHPFYQKKYGTTKGLCPISESAYERILSLPIYPSMNDNDVKRVIMSVKNALSNN